MGEGRQNVGAKCRKLQATDHTVSQWGRGGGRARSPKASFNAWANQVSPFSHAEKPGLAVEENSFRGQKTKRELDHFTLLQLLDFDLRKCSRRFLLGCSRSPKSAKGIIAEPFRGIDFVKILLQWLCGVIHPCIDKMTCSTLNTLLRR